MAQNIGKISWDFQNLMMKFCYNKEFVTLRGMQPDLINLVHKIQIEKELSNAYTILMTLNVVPSHVLELSTTKLHPELVALLRNFAYLFDEPKTLPHLDLMTIIPLISET